MSVGYDFTAAGRYCVKQYLAEDNVENLWRVGFAHRQAPRVTDTGDNSIIAMRDGKLAWPALDALQRQDLSLRFNASLAGRAG